MLFKDRGGHDCGVFDPIVCQQRSLLACPVDHIHRFLVGVPFIVAEGCWLLACQASLLPINEVLFSNLVNVFRDQKIRLLALVQFLESQNYLHFLKA